MDQKSDLFFFGSSGELSFLPSFFQDIPTWNVTVSYTDNIDFLSFPLGSVNPAPFFKIVGWVV
jgi:hypothetical protein